MESWKAILTHENRDGSLFLVRSAVTQAALGVIWAADKFPWWLLAKAGRGLPRMCCQLLGDMKPVANLFLTSCLPFPVSIFQHRKTSVMAGDAIMVMRGLTKLSKAILETQAGQLRQVLLGGDAVTIAKTLQATAEEQLSSALGKVQVSKAFCAQSSLMFCFFSRYFFGFVV